MTRRERQAVAWLDRRPWRWPAFTSALLALCVALFRALLIAALALAGCAAPEAPARAEADVSLVNSRPGTACSAALFVRVEPSVTSRVLPFVGADIRPPACFAQRSTVRL